MLMNNFDIFQLLLINKDDNNHVDIDILLQKLFCTFITLSMQYTKYHSTLSFGTNYTIKICTTQ